ncbi:carbohydrate ABC transporter permease [Bacillus salitolerans]|uniref:Carbohydrate ABC transporter permease n=1 Tax=Bacillus salitolerans TaxID=1437434 RepID=A0ABW4LUU8_9BACI
MSGKLFRPYLMVAPAITVFILFFIYPIFYMVFLSFTDWDLISPVKNFVGFDNFIDLFREDEFRQVFMNTIIYTVLTVGISMVLSLLFALWLNKSGAFYGMAQGAVFSPYIISLVSVSLLWLWLMDPQYGFLNFLLKLVGLPANTWVAHPDTALYSLVIVSVWKITGYNTLVFIAGLQSIPKELYEAAKLDQANKWRIFSKITVPMLSPTIFFLLVINTIASFQVFDTVKIMTQGGPVNSTNMLVFYIYEYGFDFFKIGYASAAGVVLLLLVGVMTIFHFKLLSKRVHYR